MTEEKKRKPDGEDSGLKPKFLKTQATSNLGAFEKFTFNLFFELSKHLSDADLFMFLLVSTAFKRYISQEAVWKPRFTQFIFTPPYDDKGWPQFFKKTKKIADETVEPAMQLLLNGFICCKNNPDIMTAIDNGAIWERGFRIFDYFTSILQLSAKVDPIRMYERFISKLKAGPEITMQDRVLAAKIFIGGKPKNMELAKHIIASMPALLWTTTDPDIVEQSVVGKILKCVPEQILSLSLEQFCSIFNHDKAKEERKLRLARAFCKGLIIRYHLSSDSVKKIGSITSYGEYEELSISLIEEYKNNCEQENREANIISQGIQPGVPGVPLGPQLMENQKPETCLQSALGHLSSIVLSNNKAAIDFWIENFPLVVKLAGYTLPEIKKLLESIKPNGKLTQADKARHLLGYAAAVTTRDDWKFICDLIAGNDKLVSQQFCRLIFANCNFINIEYLNNRFVNAPGISDEKKRGFIKHYCEYLILKIKEVGIDTRNYKKLPKSDDLSKLCEIATQYEKVLTEAKQSQMEVELTTPSFN